MAKLPVPDEVMRHLDPEMYETDEDCRDEARRIARPVVLAYLREKSRQHAGTDWDYAFLHCIDELEAGT